MVGENQIIVRCKAANPNREDMSVFVAVSCSVGERNFLQSVYMFFFLLVLMIFSMPSKVIVIVIQSDNNSYTELCSWAQIYFGPFS